MQHHGRSGGQDERPHLVDVGRRRHGSSAGGATTTTAVTSSGISTWVWVAWRKSTWQRRPPGTAGNLVAPVADHVDVDVVPGELEPVVAVARVGVGHRQPTERGPRLGGQWLRCDLTDGFTHLAYLQSLHVLAI